MGDGGITMKSKIDLTNEEIELVVRVALLDDAKNIGERFAVLLADIDIDEDGDAWVTLDPNLWRKEKVSPQAMVVAGILGIELELDLADVTQLRKWPSLAEEANSTMDYVSVLLAARADRDDELLLH